MKRISIAIVATLLLMASTSFAATQAVNTNVVKPTLQVNVTVQDAVQLTLATGTSGTACAVTTNGATSDYAMTLGNAGAVDALGINVPTCGGVYTPAQTGTNAIYYSDYQLKPLFASQPSTANPTISAYVSSNFSHANVSIVRDTANSAAAPAANGFTAMSVASGSPDSIATAVASGTAVTRWIGVDVAPTNGANMTGAQSATITFTLTVN